MKKSIFLATALISVISLILFSAVSASTYYRSQTEDAKRYLQVYMNAFVGYSLDEAGAKSFSEALNGARVTIIALDGSVLGDSEESGLPNHSDREEVSQAMLSGEGFAVRGSESVNRRMVYYCRQFDGFLVRIAVTTSSEFQIFLTDLPNIGGFLLLDIVCCLVFTYLAAVLILQPIEKLTQKAALRCRIERVPYPELKTIASLMNRMNEDIASSMAEIKRDKELVVEAQKTKDEFIANVTHEMNTPLTGIRGYAEWLKSGSLNEAQVVNASNIIYEQSVRLSNLISGIINYSELTSDDLPAYSVNLSEVCEEVIEVIRPELEEKNLTLHASVAENVSVQGRRERVSAVISNLLRNAIRYNKENGEIFVEVDDSSLSVRDTGIGIAEEDQAKVFHRFFTVDKSHNGKNGGFGLGLSLVKRICENSGWKLSLESKIGEGSCFRIDF